jgi:glycosyltransferase involved in cell wall biosynthesis
MMLGPKYSIDLVVPVLNEEKTLRSQIRILADYIHRELPPRVSVNIVIANNGSSDATADLAKELSSEISNVSVVNLAEVGVGRALRATWEFSEAEIVGYMDLDLATDLRHVKEVLEHFEQGTADIVNGSRFRLGARVHGRSWHRNVASRILNFLSRLVFGLRSTTDVMCGFKFIRQPTAAKLINVGARNRGWFFGAEILIWGEELGLKIVEIPVSWTDSPSSKVRIVRLSFQYLRDIVSNAFEIRKYRLTSRNESSS